MGRKLEGAAQMTKGGAQILSGLAFALAGGYFVFDGASDFLSAASENGGLIAAVDSPNFNPVRDGLLQFAIASVATGMGVSLVSDGALRTAGGYRTLRNWPARRRSDR